jgi:hypothetical protein
VGGHFVTPTVTNGNVYFGTGSSVVVFGLLQQAHSRAAAASRNAREPLTRISHRILVFAMGNPG